MTEAPACATPMLEQATRAIRHHPAVREEPYRLPTARELSDQVKAVLLACGFRIVASFTEADPTNLPRPRFLILFVPNNRPCDLQRGPVRLTAVRLTQEPVKWAIELLDSFNTSEYHVIDAPAGVS